MRKLKVIEMGTDVQGVRIRGDRANPEPETFRVATPWGDVDLVRTSNGDYWVHVRVNRPGCGFVSPEANMGRVKDARIDVQGRHAGEVDAGLFADPDLYHVAIRIGPDGEG